MSQSDDYEKMWKLVEEQLQQNLPKSALKTLEALIEKAETETNYTQSTKAHIYKSKILLITNERGFSEMCQYLESKIEVSPKPHKQILMQAYAMVLNNYLNQNLYKINRRTALSVENGDDPELWSTNIFHDKVRIAFIQSLESPGQIDLPIEEFEPLLNDYTKDGVQYAPSLYDVLSRKAIEYFVSPVNYVTEVQNPFKLDRDVYFSDARTFISIVSDSQDQSSQLYQAFSFFQNHIKWNIKKDRPAALARADLDRVKFVYRNSMLSNKQALYLEQLERMSKTYEGFDLNAEVLYLMANEYVSIGNQKTHTEMLNESEDPLLKASQLCELANNKYPKSEGAKFARQLHLSIHQKQLSAQVEKVLIPNEYNLLNLSAKNISEVNVKLVKLSEEEWLRWRNNRVSDPFGFLFRKSSYHSFDQTINQSKSYYNQNVELSLPPLQLGYYGILITESQFKGETKNSYVASQIAVSRLGHIVNKHSVDHELLVFDRLSGRPIEGAQVEVFASAYDRYSRENKTEHFITQTTDVEGRIELFAADQNNARYTFKITKGEDQLFLEDQEYLNTRLSNIRERIEYLIFTDRSIYRPGQQIFYKVLAVRKDPLGNPYVISNRDLSITLRDANGQEVETIQLTTNDFGTVSGQFVAPKGGLKGRMNIVINNHQGYKSIQVEEYKRPKFYVEQEEITASYKINEEVVSVIKAMNYAGNPLQGAKINYRVVRETRFPFYPYWRSYRLPQSNQKEILDGQGVLDDEGKFEVRFIAQPDDNVSSTLNPVFNYKIYSEVTDLNGETHVSESRVAVSNKSTKFLVYMPNGIGPNKNKTIKIATQNLNGANIPSSGQIKIIALKNPSRIMRDRYWSHPDTILIAKNDFERELSSYHYTDLNRIEEWEEGQLLLEKEYLYDGQTKALIDLPNNIRGGAYKVLISTQDKYGDNIEENFFFNAMDFEKGGFPNSNYLFHELDKESYQPGEIASLKLGGNEQVSVSYNIVNRNGQKGTKWLDVSSLDEILIPITEAERGGFFVHLLYVKNNRTYSEDIYIDVPWDNKALDIKFESLRNKLLPGAKEEIKLKISIKEEAAANVEYLAAMYDASLDAILPHDWASGLNGLYPKFDYSSFDQNVKGFQATYFRLSGKWKNNSKLKGKYQGLVVPDLDLSQLGSFFPGGIQPRAMSKSRARNSEEMEFDAVKVGDVQLSEELEGTVASVDVGNDTFGETSKPKGFSDEETSNQPSDKALPIRENLKETVFFYPELLTDEEGNLTMSFTMGEALTEWKLLSFAHDQSLRYAYDVQNLVTQKDLMVFPNMPRFLRDKDEMLIQAKVVNLSDETLNGDARIELIDAISGKSVNELFGIDKQIIPFELAANKSEVVHWSINVPEREVDAIQIRIIADAGKHADGEENLLPVLTDRVLVTESKSFTVDPKQTKMIDFEAFSSNQSTSLKPHKFSLEYTPNPAWYAVQALPYLMEYPHKCTEQVLNRFYANVLASHIANQHPKIKRVFDLWGNQDSDALLSNLEKNEDLKSALLKETPWLLDGKNESANKKRIANLFDLNKMGQEKKAALELIKNRQLADGGFSWFEAPRSNRYISQYVLENIGYLIKLGVLSDEDRRALRNMINKGIGYLDAQLTREYDKLLRTKVKLEEDHLSRIALHGIYARSFFNDIPVDDKHQTAYNYYLNQAAEFGRQKGIYGGALAGISLYRSGRLEQSNDIQKSLLERMLEDEEIGLYWNEGNGYRWFELPIERHALMICYLDETGYNKSVIDDLKKWLLLNKQTNHWKTTKATSAAIYSLLITGEVNISSWILEDAKTNIQVGDRSIDTKTDRETGSSYIRRDWFGTEIKKDMSKVTLENQSNHLGWGALYWQYFEDAGKVKSFDDNPLKIGRELYRIENQSSGEVLLPVDSDGFKIGDKVLVRIVIDVDRSMEFVHLNDMRASGLEPINQLSGYRWNSGLLYYESPNDLSTDFFIDYLPKGKHVFEYRLIASQIGHFSNGLGKIQCMYAPEYSSHSEGQNIVIK